MRVTAMLMLVFTSLMLVSKVEPTIVIDENTYWNQRDMLVQSEIDNMLGHDIKLSAGEKDVNEILMKYKREEMAKAFETLDFPPAKHFFHVKNEIEESQVFKFIKAMPKGALIHVHDMSMASLQWVIKELTYWDDLYMCRNEKDILLFRYFYELDDSCEWKLVADERANASSPEEFDQNLHRQLSLFTVNPFEKYSDLNAVWTSFESIFTTLSGLVMYHIAWEDYLERAFHEFVEDHIIYVEFRGVFPMLYDKDGRIFSEKETFDVYWKVISNFTYQTNVHSHERFFGAQYIYAPIRLYPVDMHQVWNDTKRMIQLKKQYPNIVAGFDLVGQEDIGHPLKDFIEPLLYLKSQNPPIPFFFHSGETNWEGMKADENLYDAILLNATRIGHGYAINKHPNLVTLAREKDIAIEVCPISNQVLKLLDDLRNHPASALAASGFPLIVTSDDPALWDADPLSHDFYEFFMGIAGAKADLKMLKRLALNSIRYSSLEEDQKHGLEAMFRGQWKLFIEEILTEKENEK